MVVDIIHGEARTLSFALKDANGAAYPLGSPTEIKVRFQKQDKSDGNVYVEKLLTTAAVVIVSDAGGTFTCAVGAADTIAMKSGKLQTVEVHLINSGGTRIAQIASAINVYKSLAEIA